MMQNSMNMQLQTQQYEQHNIDDIQNMAV